jgi:hypothetical protein
MIEVNSAHITRLIAIESTVNYDSFPTARGESFIVINRNSPILVSAPHGARTYRNNRDGIWHEEDEYTAGMAMVLGEVCSVSVIATILKSKSSDPNYHDASNSDYKQKLREIITTNKIKYVIDLHGAKKDSDFLAESQLVDLGLGNRNDYLPEVVQKKLIELIEARLGNGVTDRHEKSGFPAAGGNTIAAFCGRLNIHAVQIEMKPQLRIASRKPDASAFAREGNYKAPEETLIGMLQAITDFIEYLKEN